MASGAYGEMHVHGVRHNISHRSNRSDASGVLQEVRLADDARCEFRSGDLISMWQLPDSDGYYRQHRLWSLLLSYLPEHHELD